MLDKREASAYNVKIEFLGDMLMRVLAVNDISCVGKCSLTVALPIISASGVTCDILPTAILSTHTGGFTGYTFRDLSDDIPAILAHWKKLGLKYDFIISGYLGSIEQIEMVKQIKRDFLKESGTMIVDPVMGDNGILYSHFDQRFVEEMKGLCRTADIIVPNLTEACFLTDTDYTAVSEQDYPAILAKLKVLCPRPSVTGCDVAENGIKSCVFYTDESGKTKEYATEKIEGAFHGAGDVYVSALVGCLARGVLLDTAVEISAEFTKNSIKQTALDKTEARYGLNSESQMFKYLQALEHAAPQR